MALFLEIETTLHSLPELASVLDELDQTFGATVQLNTIQALDLDCGVRKVSWCPWPDERIELFIAGASTRGTDIIVEQQGSSVLLRVCLKALSTWTDWQLGVEAACVLADRSGAAGILCSEDSEQLQDPETLRKRLLDDDELYWNECEGGAMGIRRAVVEQGEIVRIGGPAGLAAIGPRTWAKFEGNPLDGEELSCVILDAMRASIEARGFEGFHLANPMILDGRSGQSVVALLVAPDQPTLLRDTEYLVLSEDLEGAAGAPLYMLPYEDIDKAFPASVAWLDDRNCALAAIPAASWARRLEEIKPMLLEVDQLLDQRPVPAIPPASRSEEATATVRKSSSV